MPRTIASPRPRPAALAVPQWKGRKTRFLGEQPAALVGDFEPPAVGLARSACGARRGPRPAVWAAGTTCGAQQVQVCSRPLAPELDEGTMEL
jgi:hypothetical protein